jgi:hypothetical protein
MGGFGPVALDLSAVYLVAPTLGIEMSEGLLRKLRILSGDRLQRWADEREKERKHGEP